MSYFRKTLIGQGLSINVVDIIENSLSDGTKKQYSPVLRNWFEHCKSAKIDFESASINDGLSFLAKLFNESNNGYSTLNNARSALSLVIPCRGLSGTFGEHPLVTRFMTGVFKLRPALPRYTATYDADNVIAYLDKMPSSSLRDQTRKLAVLLNILSAQRSQTIAFLDINCIHQTDSSITFYIPDILKQSKKGRHLEPITYKSYSINPNLCPVTLIKDYLSRTKGLRHQLDTKFFISYVKPHRTVKSTTIARWNVSILSDAGVDISIFKSHSLRMASSSKANTKGLSLKELNKAAGWSDNSSTFAKYYKKPIIENMSDVISSI